ncbi:hypothetical protein D3C86_1721990 [compost metagenome]
MGVCELLHWLDGVLVQMVLPANQVLSCPVAVSTFDRSGTVFRYFLQKLFDDGRARVISINEYGETKRVR